MKLIRAVVLGFLVLALSKSSVAESPKVHWTAALNPGTARVGEHAQAVLTANVDAPWHLYSLKVVPHGNIPTTVELIPGGDLTADGKAVQPTPKAVQDPNFAEKGVTPTVEYYEGGVAYGLPVRVIAKGPGSASSRIKVRYQVCKEGACDRPAEIAIPLLFKVEAGTPRSEYASAITTPPAQPSNYGNYPPAGSTMAAVGRALEPSGAVSDQTARQIAEAKRKGILNFWLLSLGFGFAALLTPCVFPMIPITVSFFAKTDQEKQARPDLRGAFAYSIGIIGTFTGLGLAMTAIFGPAGINRLAQSPWTNLVLAALFVFLAANLFGAFEIILPSWLLDRAQQGKGAGGWLGPMAMGFAFTLTSFTCTVAFVGTLLAAAAQGDWFYPALGMLAFSTAFALPFFLLALFPQFLGRLPKSGSWMISVKAFMGFLELAAALKFISNIDLYLGRGLLTRPVFLAIWAGLAIVAGLYLWGWIRLSVDTSKRYGVARRSIGALAVLTGVWCLAAINGGPLGTLASFLPPEPYPYRDRRAPVTGDKWEHDWDRALARARAEHKPIFINFTGAQCTNCRDMEANVFPLPEVSRELDRYVRLELITDQADEQSSRNAKLMDALAHVTTLPYYVITSPDGKPVCAPIGYTKDVPFFVHFLHDGYARLGATVVSAMR